MCLRADGELCCKDAQSGKEGKAHTRSEGSLPCAGVRGPAEQVRAAAAAPAGSAAAAAALAGAGVGAGVRFG